MSHPTPPPGPLTRAALHLASTRAGGWFFTTITPPLDRWLLRCTQGRWCFASFGAPTLLLGTLGRKSGIWRQTPLLYLQDGANLVIVGSRGGRRAHAHWYLNLRTHPVVWVTLSGRRQKYRAEETRTDERDRLWARLTAFNPGFNRYQQRLARTIPVIVLRPLHAG